MRVGAEMMMTDTPNRRRMLAAESLYLGASEADSSDQAVIGVLGDMGQPRKAALQTILLERRPRPATWKGERTDYGPAKPSAAQPKTN